MSDKPDETTWLDAKWLVIISAFAAFVVVVSYDGKLGLAAGVLLLSMALVWIGAALWFNGGRASQHSPVRVLSHRYEQQQRRRLKAERRVRAAGLGSGPQ